MRRMFATSASNSGQLFHRVNGYQRLGLTIFALLLPVCHGEICRRCNRRTTLLTTSNSGHQHLNSPRAHATQAIEGRSRSPPKSAWAATVSRPREGLSESITSSRRVLIVAPSRRPRWQSPRWSIYLDFTDMYGRAELSPAEGRARKGASCRPRAFAMRLSRAESQRYRCCTSVLTSRIRLNGARAGS